jgi:phosphate/sulfate permease
VLGIPNSTTHTYVGAILGVTAAHAFVHGQSIRTNINRLLENVPWWLMALSATFLGLGTADGYKRIVVTLGERLSSVKINATHGTATRTRARSRSPRISPLTGSSVLLARAP